MHIMSRKCILTTIGFCLLIVGVILAIFWMDLYQYILAKELVLSPKSRSFKLWKNPPIPINFDVYLYNWTNPRNLTSDDYEKPILKQIGPYRFTEITDKTKVKWYPRNSTISYRRRSKYYFDAEGSVGRLDDQITTLNVVALSATAKAKDWSFIKQKQVSLGLNLYSQKVYVTKNASELLFDGYQDDLIDMAREVSKFEVEKFDIPYDRFGWFYQRNESDEIGGHFNMHTGAKDISQIGNVMNWNYKPTTDFYPYDCNIVRGSGGEFYAPNQNKNTPLTIFNGELCRPLDLFFTNELNINGLNVYKYSANERSIDNGTNYPEYKCYFYGDSLPSGVMNVSACRFGAPAFVSFPHYYAADPYYLSHVDGIKPSKDLHEFYIALEPNTGIPIEVAARLQVNVLVRPSPNIALYQDAPYMFFPIIWFEQKVRIPDEMIDEIKIAVTVPIIGYISIGIIITTGIIILVWLGIQQLRLEKNDNEKQGKNSIDIDRFSGKTPEVSLLMKPKKTIEKHENEKNGINELTVTKLAPLAIDECDAELLNCITKESIMMPH